MKKIILVCICLFCIPCFADNSVRIKELTDKLNQTVQEINQATQFIQQKQADALKLQGAIEELQTQDK